MVPCSSMYSTISWTCLASYPSRFSERGTVLLTMVSMPPPTSLLYFTRAMSGSTPVVSQSIMKAMVPVGASTEICEFRTPCSSPASHTVSHTSRTAVRRSSGTCAEAILCAWLRCMSSTLSMGFRLTS